MGFKTRMDRVIVVDLESTAWESKDPPEGQTSDILEIGVCELDLHTLLRVKLASYITIPTRSQISDFSVKINGITEEVVKHRGLPLATALSQMRLDFRTKDRSWASWGDYDRKMIERSCREMNIPYPFGPRHLNVKNLFAMGYGRDSEVGMAGALEELGMTLDGRHHSGVDDANNIAKILAYMLRGIRATKPTKGV
jgi:inhibitor of KinA sporulation pathway (predicted exonuclease)